MNYTIETIADFCRGKADIAIPGSTVKSIWIDHRELNWKGGLFAAIKGQKVDGHAFIPQLIEQGVRNFLVTNSKLIEQHKGTANFILVNDMVAALQDIAREHRDNFKIPVVGITGSNGKTVVKEWLNTLLEKRHQICRSPKSFNSQIGVALSLIRIENRHTLGIFEAGISRPGEMEKLQKMMLPDYGIFTNLGDAHAAHFESAGQKLEEKMMLFSSCSRIVCCQDQKWFEHYIGEAAKRFFTWSRTNELADVYLQSEKNFSTTSELTLKIKDSTFTIRLPFIDRASIENALQCFCMLVLLERTSEETLRRFELLSPIAMRMEMKQGIENSILIDDSYNSDLGSLRAALEQLSAQKGRKRMMILSDMYDNDNSGELYRNISNLLNDANLDELVAIGPELERHNNLFRLPKVEYFPTTDAYWLQLETNSLRNKAILIKGAREFKLEQLVQRLQAQQHETFLEIDLHKLGKNLEFFKTKIQLGVKTMVMVKAFSYGAGGFEVANFLQTQGVDYLAVAYADEGVELRKRNVHMPILVMSPSKSAYESIVRFDLEPEIYSLRSLNEFIETAQSMRHLFDQLTIHIKIDSGMHRLGFGQDDIEELSRLLKTTSFLKVGSVFTHLSAADNPAEDDFTLKQIERYTAASDAIQSRIGYSFLRHVLNSTGILRFPQFQFDMVRLGIGLYGFSSTENGRFLNALGAFKSYIIQIRIVSASESVGYSRSGKEEHERKIATVAVGYADGLDRRLSNGRWSLKWQGHSCPIVGNICMDMVMIDVSGCDAREGDEVVIFEGADDILLMAQRLDTIPYEILTKVSQRVRRVYLQE